MLQIYHKAFGRYFSHTKIQKSILYIFESILFQVNYILREKLCRFWWIGMAAAKIDFVIYLDIDSVLGAFQIQPLKSKIFDLVFEWNFGCYLSDLFNDPFFVSIFFAFAYVKSTIYNFFSFIWTEFQIGCFAIFNTFVDCSFYLLNISLLMIDISAGFFPFANLTRITYLF